MELVSKRRLPEDGPTAQERSPKRLCDEGTLSAEPNDSALPAPLLEEEFISVEKSVLRTHVDYSSSYLLRSFLENDPDDEETTLTVPKRMVLFTLQNDQEFFQFIDVFKYWMFFLPTAEWLSYLFEHLDRLSKEHQLASRLDGLVFYQNQRKPECKTNDSCNKNLRLVVCELLLGNKRAMEHVVAAGMVNVLQLMMKHRFTAFPDLLAVALKHGDVHMFDHLLSLKLVPPSDLFSRVLVADRFDLLRMLWKQSDSYQLKYGVNMRTLIKKEARSRELLFSLDGMESEQFEMFILFAIKKRLVRFKDLVIIVMSSTTKCDSIRFLYSSADNGLIKVSESELSDRPNDLYFFLSNGSSETINFIQNRFGFSQYDRENGTEFAVKEGNLIALKRILEAGLAVENDKHRQLALAKDHWEMFCFLHDRWKSALGEEESRKCKDLPGTKGAFSTNFSTRKVLEYLFKDGTLHTRCAVQQSIARKDESAFSYLFERLKLPVTAESIVHCINYKFTYGLNFLLPRMKGCVTKQMKMRLACNGNCATFSQFTERKLTVLFGDGCEQIDFAIRNLNSYAFRRLIQLGATISESAVFTAVRCGNSCCLKELLDLVPSVDVEKVMVAAVQCQNRTAAVMKTLISSRNVKFRLEHLLVAIRNLRNVEGPEYLIMKVGLLCKSGPKSPIDMAVYNQVVAAAHESHRITLSHILDKYRSMKSFRSRVIHSDAFEFVNCSF